jgi:hypothetical protein
MTRIDGTARLAEIIRRQVDAARDAARRPSANDQATRAAGGGAPTGTGPLADVVARRIRGIDEADPDRRRKAFRIFLESALLAELGQQLINDPGFYELVAQVQAQMEADTALASAIDEAGDLLLGAGRTR